DEVAERIEAQVLAERGCDGELPGRDAQSPPELEEREPEDRAIDGMHREARCAPLPPPRHRLPEQRDVRVVAAEDTFVERLLNPPERCGRRAGRGGSSSAGHAASPAGPREPRRPRGTGPCRPSRRPSVRRRTRPTGPSSPG